MDSSYSHDGEVLWLEGLPKSRASRSRRAFSYSFLDVMRLGRCLEGTASQVTPQHGDLTTFVTGHLTQ